MMKCSGCSGEQRGLLHHVRHRGDHRRYCTGCVLKNHPGSFCFHCFDVFEGPPPSDSIIKCSNCPSLSHSTCAAAAAAAGGSTSSSSSRSCLLLCPTCSNPSFLFFEASPVLDLASAKVLLAASTIASQSMRKAAAAAKLDADRKVREAAFARKRAREALEKASVALLMPPPPPSATAAAKGKHQINNNKISSIAAVAAAAAASSASAEQRRNVAASVKMKAGSITTPSPAATVAASNKRLPNTSMMPPPTLKEKEEKLQTIAAPPIVQLQRLPRANIAVKEPKVAASELVGNDNVSNTTRPTINANDGSESKAKSGTVLTGT